MFPADISVARCSVPQRGGMGIGVQLFKGIFFLLQGFLPGAMLLVKLALCIIPRLLFRVMKIVVKGQWKLSKVLFLGLRVFARLSCLVVKVVFMILPLQNVFPFRQIIFFYRVARSCFMMMRIILHEILRWTRITLRIVKFSCKLMAVIIYMINVILCNMGHVFNLISIVFRCCLAIV